jgi:hypothetical protein
MRKIYVGKQFNINGKPVKISKIFPDSQICNLVFVDNPNKSAGQLTFEDIKNLKIPLN